MIKTSQERGFLNKLREKTNLSGKVLESINPEFAKMMDNLRETDEKIRNQAAGIRNIVKWSRTLVNRRDYLSAALNLSAFHERCRQISFDLEQCRSKVDLKHFKFLLDQFDDEYKEKLFGYDPEKKLEERTKAEAKEIATSLTKISGLSDFLSLPMSDMAQNLTNSRNSAMRALEKKFSVGFLKTLKVESSGMVEKTEDFLSYMLSVFKKLATALATRNAQDYIGYANDFIKKFSTYHRMFVKYYAANIAPLKQQHEEMSRQKEEDASRELEENANKARPAQLPGAQNGFPDAKEQGKLLTDQDHVNVLPAAQKPDQDSLLNQLERAHGPVDAKNNVVLSPDAKKPPAIGPSPEDQDDTVVNKGIKPLPFNPYKPKKAAHTIFINDLEKMASANDMTMLVDSILKYAAMIEETNETDALKLIAIAEGVMEDYNLAAEKKTKSTVKPEVAAPADPLALDPPAPRPSPVSHGIPDGNVNQKYFSIPFLKNITADKIRITPGAASHITNVFIKRLFDLNMDIADFGVQLEQKILTELKLAIVRGIVLTSMPTEDAHNPRDRYLEVYSYMNLPSIDRKLHGIVKLKISCRLSVFTGTLSVRTIQRNFKVE